MSDSYDDDNNQYEIESENAPFIRYLEYNKGCKSVAMGKDKTVGTSQSSDSTLMAVSNIYGYMVLMVDDKSISILKIDTLLKSMSTPTPYATSLIRSIPKLDHIGDGDKVIISFSHDELYFFVAAGDKIAIYSLVDTVKNTSNSKPTIVNLKREVCNASWKSNSNDILVVIDIEEEESTLFVYKMKSSDLVDLEYSGVQDACWSKRNNYQDNIYIGLDNMTIVEYNTSKHKEVNNFSLFNEDDGFYIYYIENVGDYIMLNCMDDSFILSQIYLYSCEDVTAAPQVFYPAAMPRDDVNTLQVKYLNDLKLIILLSNNGAGVELLELDNDVWVSLTLNDDSRAEVSDSSFPTALSLITCSMDKPTNTDALKLKTPWQSAVPIVAILDIHGHLYLFNMFNLDHPKEYENILKPVKELPAATTSTTSPLFGTTTPSTTLQQQQQKPATTTPVFGTTTNLFGPSSSSNMFGTNTTTNPSPSGSGLFNSNLPTTVTSPPTSSTPSLFSNTPTTTNNLFNNNNMGGVKSPPLSNTPTFNNTSNNSIKTEIPPGKKVAKSFQDALPSSSSPSSVSFKPINDTKSIVMVQPSSSKQIVVKSTRSKHLAVLMDKYKALPLYKSKNSLAEAIRKNTISLEASLEKIEKTKRDTESIISMVKESGKSPFGYNEIANETDGLGETIGLLEDALEEVNKQTGLLKSKCFKAMAQSTDLHMYTDYANTTVYKQMLYNRPLDPEIEKKRDQILKSYASMSAEIKKLEDTLEADELASNQQFINMGSTEFLSLVYHTIENHQEVQLLQKQQLTTLENRLKQYIARNTSVNMSSSLYSSSNRLQSLQSRLLMSGKSLSGSIGMSSGGSLSKSMLAGGSASNTPSKVSKSTSDQLANYFMEKMTLDTVKSKQRAQIKEIKQGNLSDSQDSHHRNGDDSVDQLTGKMSSYLVLDPTQTVKYKNIMSALKNRRPKVVKPLFTVPSNYMESEDVKEPSHEENQKFKLDLDNSFNAFETSKYAFNPASKRTPIHFDENLLKDIEGEDDDDNSSYDDDEEEEEEEDYDDGEFVDEPVKTVPIPSTATLPPKITPTPIISTLPLSNIQPPQQKSSPSPKTSPLNTASSSVPTVNSLTSFSLPSSFNSSKLSQPGSMLPFQPLPGGGSIPPVAASTLFGPPNGLFGKTDIKKVDDASKPPLELFNKPVPDLFGKPPSAVPKEKKEEEVKSKENIATPPSELFGKPSVDLFGKPPSAVPKDKKEEDKSKDLFGKPPSDLFGKPSVDLFGKPPSAVPKDKKEEEASKPPSELFNKPVPDLFGKPPSAVPKDKKEEDKSKDNIATPPSELFGKPTVDLFGKPPSAVPQDKKEEDKSKDLFGKPPSELLGKPVPDLFGKPPSAVPKETTPPTSTTTAAPVAVVKKEEEKPASDIFGKPPSELLGKPIPDLFGKPPSAVPKETTPPTSTTTTAPVVVKKEEPSITSKPEDTSSLSLGGLGFGTKDNTNVFTTPTKPTGTSIFGTVSTPPPSTNVFAQPTTPVTPSTPSNGAFIGAGSTPSSSFGGNTSIFGKPTTSAPFGGAAATTTSTGAFGGTSVFSQPSTTGFGSTPSNPGGSVFGQPSSSSSGTSIFGSTTSNPGGSVFGQASSNPGGSVFGQSSTSAFGSSTPAAPTFGSTSAFGGAGSTTTPSAFGSTSTAPTFGSTSAFGGAGSTAPSAFGGSTPAFGSTSAFGGAGTTSNPSGSVFGSSTPSAFGSSSAAPTFGSTSAFGGGSTSNPSGSVFGSTTSAPSFGSTSAFGGGSTSNPPGSVFGSTTSAPPFGGNTSAFGAAPNTSAFGGAASASNPSGSVFGQSTSNPSGSVFGSTSAFGGASTPSNPSGSVFGSTSAFGGGGFGQTSSTPAFGSQSAFSQPGANQPIFGGGAQGATFASLGGFSK